jgi:GT2 family glycosyltransferase
MPKLSIIIVNWNTCGLLIDCLDSIYQCPVGYDFDIWVVDNASSDGSPQAVRQKFPQVFVIENTENVGFAKGNNQAIQQSSGSYVLLLNSDTVVKEGALENLVKFMDETPQAGASGPLLLNSDGSLQVSCYPFPNLSREFWRLLHFDLIRPYGTYNMWGWDRTINRRVDAIQGACLLLRRSVIDQVGMLDPDYFMYTEEIDLCYRIQKTGLELYWVPQAEVIHYGGQSTRQMPARMFLSLYKTKVQFFRKNYGRYYAIVYKLILFITSVIRILFSPIALLLRSSQRENTRYLISRYIDLITHLASF